MRMPVFDPEFFPTPRHLAARMVAKIDKEARNFLEPSAGRGDLVEAIIASRDRYAYGGNRNVKVDCIESCPELVAVLNSKEFPIVGYDWLNYDGVCYYDGICMNPPFSNGDEHLLRAWDFMHNGEIVCLLNSETLNNPYSEKRKRLAKIVEQYGNVEDLGDCFSRDAERATGVNVSMVYLKKVADDDVMDMWASTTEEKGQEEFAADPNMLAIRDDLGNMQHYYDAANEHMLKAFYHARKANLYLAANHCGDNSDYEKILGTSLSNVNTARAEFGRKHRRDAWMHVFERMEFRKWLDKKQTEAFVRDIERNGNVPFTKENIKGTLQNVYLQRGMLFEKSVANVFDALTSYFKGNTVHTEGWKTNDNYKVNERLVFPYGCRYDKFSGFNLWFGSSSQIDIYNDLDRVMCVLDKEDFTGCLTIHRALDAAFDATKSRGNWPRVNELAAKGKASSRYFDIRFFKKGTVHLKFKDEDLMDLFNQTAAKGKKWIGSYTQSEGTAA